MGIFLSSGKLLKKIQSDLDSMKQDLGALKDDVSALKDDVGALKDDVGALKDDMGALKTDVEFLKTEVAVMKGELCENTRNLEVLMEGAGLPTELAMAVLFSEYFSFQIVRHSLKRQKLC